MVKVELGHRPYERVPFCLKRVIVKVKKKSQFDSQYGIN